MFRRFETWLALSVLLHAIAAMLWLSQEKPAPIVAAKSPNNTISVGLQAALTALANTPMPPLDTPIEPFVEPKPQVEAIPVEAPKPKPEPQREDKPKPPVKPLEKPKPKPKETPKPKEKTKPIAPKPVAVVAQQENKQGTQQAQVVEAKGSGEQQGGAFDPQLYDLAVREHLLARKETPKRVRSNRKSAVVMVEFVIDRQGNVLKHQISTPSRVRELDRAAVKLIKDAAPYPVAPAQATWQERRYQIDINYKINS